MEEDDVFFDAELPVGRPTVDDYDDSDNPFVNRGNPFDEEDTSVDYTPT
jgi:hypothetical protein